MIQPEKMVGIAGPPGTRIPSIAKGIAGLFNKPRPTIVSFADYDMYPAGSEEMKAELANPTIINWENPALFDMETFAANLRTLAMGEGVVLAAQSRETVNSGKKDKVLRPRKLIIAEGTFALHEPEVAELFDLKVYMELDVEDVVSWQLAHGAERGGNGPWDDPDYIRGPMVLGTRNFIEPQREVADLVLDGRLPIETHVAAIAHYLHLSLVAVSPSLSSH